MIDKEQISIMIKDIGRYLSDLNRIDIPSKKDLEEPEAFYAVSMVIFAVMNRTIDIGNEIIAGSGEMSLPATYKDTFELLSKNKVITTGLAAKMIFLARYRNIIAHEYHVLSADELYSLKKKIYDVEGFIAEIKKFLERK